MNYFSNFKGLPRQAYKLGALRVLVCIGSMTFVFASLLYTSILGLTEFQASLLVMTMSFLNAFGTILGGKFADVFGRKKTYVMMSFLSACFLITGGNVCTTRWVIPFMLLSNMCSNACFPAVSALLSDSVDDSNRVESFSLIYLCANFGFAIGPSIGGMIFYDHMPWCFFIQGIVFFLSGVFFYFFIHDDYIPTRLLRRQDGGNNIRQGNYSNKLLTDMPQSDETTFALLLQRKPLLCFIVALVILTMCYQLISFLLPLQMEEDFGLEISSRLAGRNWTVNGAVIVLFGPLLLGFIKNHHQFFNVGLGAILYAVGFGMYTVVRTPGLYMLSALIWSLGEVILSTGAGAYISENSPETHRGRFQSTYDTGRLIGRGIAPPLFTLIVGHMGHRGSWVVSAIICLAVSAWMFLSLKKFGLKANLKKSRKNNNQQ